MANRVTYHPDFETFCKLAEDGHSVPVYRQLTSDTLTPVSAFCKIQGGDSAFLFESVIGGEQVGRYSFLGADPYLQFEAYENRVVTIRDGVREETTCEDPLTELERCLLACRAVGLPELPRFCGGAVGYAGYDVVRYTERLREPPQDDRNIPDLAFGFYSRMVIFDHIRKIVFLVAQSHVQETADNTDQNSRKSCHLSRKFLSQVYQSACQRVDELAAQLQSPKLDLELADLDFQTSESLNWESNIARKDFESAVKRAKEYIRSGDIFQVVLSQRLSTVTQARPFDIYRTLRVVNPSPFMFFLRTPEVTLVGASPEIMVRVEDGVVTVRPLAGTRRRGKTQDEDRQLAEELLADPKERAEHIMLVDLGRNDVGRVAQYRSVQLSDVMTIEKYSHVMHITSNVTGQLRSETTSFDALRSCLPAGTVSGAPKVRAMEIIDELELHRRGPYAGAVGYIDFTGNMDTCIALRTLVMQGRTAYVQAGAGIVADSVPETEYQETINKAQGLLKAIEIAECQLSKRY